MRLNQVIWLNPSFLLLYLIPLGCLFLSSTRDTLCLVKPGPKQLLIEFSRNFSNAFRRRYRFIFLLLSVRLLLVFRGQSIFCYARIYHVLSGSDVTNLIMCLSDFTKQSNSYIKIFTSVFLPRGGARRQSSPNIVLFDVW